MQEKNTDRSGETGGEPSWLADGSGAQPGGNRPSWIVLIVDDDRSVHEVTKLVLSGSLFAGRALAFMHAHTAEQARAVLSAEPDVALVLLDIVMESDDAGLDLVRFIRQDLGNRSVRILLRTGQSGDSVQTDIVTAYDINGYLDKAVLTSPQLFCAVHTALSTYRDLAALDATQRELWIALHEAYRGESRLRSLHDHSPIGMAEVALDGHFVGANPALCSMLGYTVEELTSRTFQSITHPDDLALDLANTQQLLDGKRETYRMDKRYVRKSGEIIHIQLDVALLKDKAGQPEGFLAQIQNVEDRVATEQNLRSLGQRLGLAVRSARLGVWSWDLESGRITWDAEMYAMYGIAPDTVMSFERWKSAMLAEDILAVEANFARTVEQRRPMDMQFRVQHAELGLRYIEASEDVMLDSAGKVVSVVGVNRDVTRQRQIEDALLQRQAEIVKLSLTDPLTDLANRRRMDEQLDLEIRRVQRYGGKLSLAIADLDHFKRVNDEYGHEIGDAVLRAFSRTMESQVRDSDLVARIGGEEFVISMPQSGRDAAETLIERIRLSLARLVIPPLRHPVTASFGVAEFRLGETPEQILRRADQALYKAKSGGRNRIVVAPEEVALQPTGRFKLFGK